MRMHVCSDNTKGVEVQILLLQKGRCNRRAASVTLCVCLCLYITVVAARGATDFRFICSH